MVSATLDITPVITPVISLTILRLFILEGRFKVVANAVPSISSLNNVRRRRGILIRGHACASSMSNGIRGIHGLEWPDLPLFPIILR